MRDYDFSKDKNQVATPLHISELIYDLFDAKDRIVLDPTAGAGALLAYAKHAVGIEYDANAFQLLSNNIQSTDLINASVFDCADWIREKKPNAVLMNPPFNCKKEDMPEEYRKLYGAKGTDSTKGLYFVQWVADVVGSGRLAAIVPTGAIGDGNKAIKQTKERLLSRHTLEAVVSLNPELFYPNVSVSVVILFLKLGEPHHGETWFADFTNDGFEKDRRTKSRTDKSGKWAEVKSGWVKMFEEKPSDLDAGCKLAEVTAASTWCPRTHTAKPPEPLTDDDLYKTVKDYIDWKIKQVGYENVVKEILTPEERLKLLRQREKAILQEIQNLEAEIQEE